VALTFPQSGGIDISRGAMGANVSIS